VTDPAAGEPKRTFDRDEPPLGEAARAALAANLEKLRARVAAACARVKRDPAGVGLVAVTKYSGVAFARALLDLGQRDLGENRTDHLAGLDGALGARSGARWHMIGHLQRNKAKEVAGRLAALHSLDSLDLAKKLDALRPPGLPPVEVYVELRLDDSTEGRSGVAEADLPAFLASLRGVQRLRVVGLMGLPPHPDGAPAEVARPHFQRLARLAREHGLSGLSMGMTHDLEVAVEEGATVIRVGRALLEGVR
jgi:pyridoxal phosphate enzyme (YggS family)